MVWRPGRNPLRRSVDRIEVALMIALVAVYSPARRRDGDIGLGSATPRRHRPDLDQPIRRATGLPLNPSQIAHQGALAGVLAVAGLAVLVIVSALVIRRILDCRRMAWWDTEWSATGPQWCKYR